MRLNKRPMVLRFLVLALPVCSFCAAQAHASTWTVAKDGTGLFTSVQAGIDAAATNDTVLVAPGTYTENLLFQGRDIVLISSAGPEVTVLDGSANALPVIQFRNGESNATNLTGFTVKGGSGGGTTQGWSGGGGGVLIFNAEPTITGNIISENRADRSGVVFGGGVYCLGTETRDWHPVIARNHIHDNVAAWNGGGVGAVNGMAPTIIGNRIEENAVSVGDGGGIWGVESRWRIHSGE